MEKTLARLFDYQKYESNSRLDKIIKGVEERYPRELQAMTDDELMNVNAAGNTDAVYLKALEARKIDPEKKDRKL